MSNFPIIRTTPPPLDVNESEEEEEPDFRNLSDLSPEEEKDIDFVVPDFTDNETEAQTSSDLTDKTTFEDKDDSEDIDDKSIDEKDMNVCDNVCDNSPDIQISEIDQQIVETNESKESSVDSNQNHLDSNQNHFNHNIVEKLSEVEEKVVDNQEFGDFNGMNNEEFDFADFTSFQSI